MAKINQWKYMPERYNYMDKILINEVWRHKNGIVFMTVDNAWLGRGHMREGYVIEVKTEPDKRIIRREVAYTKKEAMRIAKQIRDEIDYSNYCQCGCDDCLSGNHCRGLICRGD